ncbi:MAG: DUF294 nucleotidyltransferase-like domain-containing protein [Magnetovibrionaceae bacterium]
MDIELIEIRDFLSGFHPFDLLPKAELEGLPESMSTSFARKGSEVITPGAKVSSLFIVRTGSVETHAPDGQLLARLAEGECFGVRGLMADDRLAVNRVTAMEDSLFYQMPEDDFYRLCKDHAQFAFYFNPLGAGRLRDAHVHGKDDEDDGLNLMSMRVDSMLGREPITIEVGATIQEAAQVMKEKKVSCILVTKGGELAGIFTDRDIRGRVVAEGRPVEDPIESVMTPDPIRLDADNFAFDALLMMMRKNIHHLPITRGDEVAGVVTNTNFLRRQTKSAVYLVGDIYKKTTYEGLAEDIAHIPEVLVSLIEAGGTSHNIGHIITSITDALTVRLLQLAEEKFGSPPVPYLWCAAGSQGRQEQTGVSDQDNCMILHDDYNEAEHGDYFKQFATFVCDGLDACGYVYCPGEMMGMTDQWRQPLRVWKKYYTQWTEEPEPKALMLSAVWFDLRPIRGAMGLYDELQEIVRRKAQNSSIFMQHMIGNALTHHPPLGFFKNFVLIKGGEHDSSFDMKHTGVVPIVDIARIYALHTGCSTVNTHERLHSGGESRYLSPSGARDLQDAYEFISITRLKNQAAQIARGEKPNNFMAPDEMSQFERSHLKDAFSVVKTIQSAMTSGY